jgi:phage terminase large subunit-like protein
MQASMSACQSGRFKGGPRFAPDRSEGGRVYLPRQALWLDAFEAEQFAFPGGRHDDQVDSAVQALAYTTYL